MRKVGKLGAAFVLAGFIAGGMTVFSTTAHAATTTTARPALCDAVNALEAYVEKLPAGPLKDFLIKHIEAIEAKYGCS